MEKAAEQKQGTDDIEEFLVALCLCPVSAHRGGHRPDQGTYILGATGWYNNFGHLSTSPFLGQSHNNMKRGQ
jgi:hypothetical protein